MKPKTFKFLIVALTLTVPLLGPLVATPAWADSFYTPGPDGSPPAPEQPVEVKVGEQPKVIKNVSVIEKVESQLQVECSFNVERPRPAFGKFKTLALSNSEEICQALANVEGTELKFTLHVIAQENLGVPAFWVHKMVFQSQDTPEGQPPPEGEYTVIQNAGIMDVIDAPIQVHCSRGIAFKVGQDPDILSVIGLSHDNAICNLLAYAQQSNTPVTVTLVHHINAIEIFNAEAFWVIGVEFE